eukprot:CAMPEP_0178918794 /NCGR_PEP_ID=MMETSP0786-20121207/14033_1 /TAXON_ID=186022 /ORGANISM="Thalassionema frauenfeldii, Strain CCMP 1798" /LENGTH=491 /DNA_ID=CAMNT_0020592561 /DNA_START=61 /DNA_END=1536 /DNA_ORIENTATION=-
METDLGPDNSEGAFVSDAGEDFFDEQIEHASSVTRMLSLKAKLRRMMEESSSLLLIIPTTCIVMSYFGCYVMKYPLFVVDYKDEKLFGIGIKDGLSYAFTLGFFVGKFPSYTYVPSIERDQRFKALLILFGATAVFMTGFLPLPTSTFTAVVKTTAVFIGSLFATAIFGAEMLYMEGRSNGDILIAAINCVVTFGSSICRAIGESLIEAGIPGRWMPLSFVMFYSPVVITTLFCLDAIPNPSEADIQAMGERTVMTSSQKTAFLQRHGLGLAPLLIGYAFSMGFRFLRDFFALEIYRDFLQREPAPFDYLLADWVGGFVAVIIIVGMSRVANNAMALMLLHGMIVGAAVIMGFGAILFTKGMISPRLFIILVGISVSLSMTPFSGSLFDRVIACTRTKGTAIFLIFLGDACGYVGIFLCLFYKTAHSGDTSYSELFLNGCYGFTGIILITGLLSAIYWYTVSKKIRVGEYDEMENEAILESDEVSLQSSSN